jgi:hypothetical protein
MRARQENCNINLGTRKGFIYKKPPDFSEALNFKPKDLF